MLCTAHHHYDSPAPYKKAHYNHPSTVWTRENVRHYTWLWNHMIALGNEYTKRYSKTHLSITKMLDAEMYWCPKGMPCIKFKQPPQCMPDEYKDKCSVQAYWNYYIGEKHVVANPKKEKIYEQRINKPN